MQFLTDRKRAQGLGSSSSGTEHHWQHLVSSVVLVFLVPLFVFTFGAGMGGSFEEVQAFFGRPFPAIVTGLMLVVGILHLLRETQEAIEDYIHGVTGKLVRIGAGALAYTMIAAGLFALVKLAL